MIDDDTDDEFDLEDIVDDVDIEDEEALKLDDDLEDAPPPEPKKPLTRGQREIVNLRKRAQDAERDAREARELAAKASGGVDALTRSFQQPRVDPREEQERVAQMSDREYATYLQDRERAQIQQAFAQTNFQTADAVDQVRFDRLTEKNPAYAAIADEVENRLNKLRSQNQNVDRKTIANLILGEKAAARAGRPAKTEARKTQRSAVGNDVSGARSEVRQAKKGKTAKDRLDGIQF